MIIKETPLTHRLYLSGRLALIAILSTSLSAVPKSGFGIHGWCDWNPRQASVESCPELKGGSLVLHWRKVEPEPGQYRFDTVVGDRLRTAKAQGIHVTVMTWVAPSATPDWLFKSGVPAVYTDRDVNPLGKKMSRKDNRFPYYLSPAYKEHFFKLIEEFGKYVASLPPELRERILYVQSAEGSTGDGQPYKGKPLDARYSISKAAWNEFRRETWQQYQRSFPGLPVLVNSDANDGEETRWLLENMDCIALKYGMFSHGYHVSENRARLAGLRDLRKQASSLGKPLLTRGEQDGEMFVYGWSTRNIPQGLYWSALFATHCGLDVWNIPHPALRDEANLPAFAFFNKYAGRQDPATAPAAFCALRDGLDASDFERFPAAKFGGKPGKKRDKERYLAIARAYSKYGARMDDPDKALGGGMINRKRSGSNDVGWGILPGNYSRFLTQLDPGSGDVGRWNLDNSIHGRFARALEHSTSKTRMRFKLDRGFFPDPEKPRSIRLTITWLDKGDGKWSLQTVGANHQPRTVQFHNEDSGRWISKTLELADICFNGGLGGADLLLRHDSGDDTAFHMIEIERGQ